MSHTGKKPALGVEPENDKECQQKRATDESHRQVATKQAAASQVTSEAIPENEAPALGVELQHDEES